MDIKFQKLLYSIRSGKREKSKQFRNKKKPEERLDTGSCNNDTIEFGSFSFENSNINKLELQSMIRVYCQFVLAQYKLIDMK